MKSARPASIPPLVRKSDRRLLRLASSVGAYPGDRWDLAARDYARLGRIGLVRVHWPNNPVHKPRAVITDAGRTVLIELEKIYGR